jgi:hypothetical protein
MNYIVNNLKTLERKGLMHKVNEYNFKTDLYSMNFYHVEFQIFAQI